MLKRGHTRSERMPKNITFLTNAFCCVSISCLVSNLGTNAIFLLKMIVYVMYMDNMPGATLALLSIAFYFLLLKSVYRSLLRVSTTFPPGHVLTCSDAQMCIDEKVILK